MRTGLTGKQNAVTVIATTSYKVAFFCCCCWQCSFLTQFFFFFLSFVVGCSLTAWPQNKLHRYLSDPNTVVSPGDVFELNLQAELECWLKMKHTDGRAKLWPQRRQSISITEQSFGPRALLLIQLYSLAIPWTKPRAKLWYRHTDEHKVNNASKYKILDFLTIFFFPTSCRWRLPLPKALKNKNKNHV